MAGLLTNDSSTQQQGPMDYDTINTVISVMYILMIMLPSIMLHSFMSIAITFFKPYPTPFNVLIAHGLLCEMIFATTRGASFVYTIIEIASDASPQFSCQFSDALLRLMLMLMHTNLAALIFVTFYGLDCRMMDLNLSHGIRLVVIQWAYSLMWTTLHHFILGPDIMQQRASRCIFEIDRIEIDGLILAIFTGMVTVIASTLWVITFGTMTYLKARNITLLDEDTEKLIKSVQKYTVWNSLALGTLAIPTTVYYWIAPLYIDINEAGASLLPSAVAYVTIEFTTQIVLQVYLITDAINVLITFTEVRFASKKLLMLIFKRIYMIWEKWQQCCVKHNKVAPMVGTGEEDGEEDGQVKEEEN